VRCSFVRRFLAVFPLVAVLVLSGCGGGGTLVKVEGQLVRTGAPYQAASGEVVKLSFKGKKSSGEDTVYAMNVTPDGKFTTVGTGLPPGKYAIHLNLTGGGTDPASLERMKQSGLQFQAINGKEYEVTTDSLQKITIDIGNGSITK
jgi:hypothetical protein